MTRDIISINDYTVLMEGNESDQDCVDSCFFDEPVIAVAFYGSGNVQLNVKYGEKQELFQHTKGLALAFYADEKVEFQHLISPDKPLKCLVVATALRHIEQLPEQEGELFGEFLHQLVYPEDHYVGGPQFYMTPHMLSIIEEVFTSRYEGKARMMFFRSQITSLLAQFFGQLSLMPESTMPTDERAKLEQARDILLKNLEHPPSLSELSREIGLNTNKLKRNFKELFGLPVFRYLQNERLTKAHDLIRSNNMSIQEVAWHVGYDSLSSFSNAFTDKFGYRPSQLKQ